MKSYSQFAYKHNQSNKSKYQHYIHYTTYHIINFTDYSQFNLLLITDKYLKYNGKLNDVLISSADRLVVQNRTMKLKVGVDRLSRASIN